MKYKHITYIIINILYFVFIDKSMAQNEVKLSTSQKEIIASIPNNLVIAHRGTTFYAPEESEAAMRWARNIGADYLEFDLQRTKDGRLIALHDDKLTRTTDIGIKFPNRQNNPVSTFNYEELLTLDIGSWFNNTYPDRAKKGFVGLDILTLEDIINIAEGKRIRRDIKGRRILNITKKGIFSTYEIDPNDNGNRPGIYVETKVPALFPNIEKDLKAELVRLAWYHSDIKKLKKIKTIKGKVEIANSPNRVILQTFSKESLLSLQIEFKRPIPTCFLLWRGTDIDDIPSDSLSAFEEWVIYGLKHGATIIGPSIAGEPNNYVELLNNEHFEIIKRTGLKIHGYSFDTKDQLYNSKRYV
jgi:glycerophosphoryl diester phosphodiesterase